MTPFPQALIFDCDGTLALTGDLHFMAFVKAFAAQGASFDRVFYEARTGYDRHSLITEWIPHCDGTLDADALIRDSIAEAGLLAASGFATGNPPVAALATAWGVRPSAVASNGEETVVRATLKACGMEKLFDTVVTRDQVMAGKPNPAMFLLAAERLRVNPCNCLVLEDSAQGMQAAERAGIPALDVRETSALDQIKALQNLLN
jgi:beta-phosphoglucomutase-like phosphatase (HAD superfamily)